MYAENNLCLWLFSSALLPLEQYSLAPRKSITRRIFLDWTYCLYGLLNWIDLNGSKMKERTSWLVYSLHDSITKSKSTSSCQWIFFGGEFNLLYTHKYIERCARLRWLLTRFFTFHFVRLPLCIHINFHFFFLFSFHSIFQMLFRGSRIIEIIVSLIWSPRFRHNNFVAYLVLVQPTDAFKTRLRATGAKRQLISKWNSIPFHRILNDLDFSMLETN